VPAAFRFVQFEFGFLLGPADGRYLTRTAPDEEPELVVVLGTLGAPQRRLIRGRKPTQVEAAEPEPVPTARATLIAPSPFDSHANADRWLANVSSGDEPLQKEVDAAVLSLNGLLRAHRAAALDPYTRDIGADQALAVRVGYGNGEQVADGRYTKAYELPVAKRGPRRRREQLAPQERLAAVLGGRDKLLAGEELALRARADLDAERPREAALQARVALEALIAELGAENRDVAGLTALREEIGKAANAALTGDPPPELAQAVSDAVDAMERELRRRALTGP
jgi:hypothetical protein